MALKILIVDDDDIAGGLSRDLLQDAGFNAELITNSLKAMDTLRAMRPEVAVLDILMPGIDGLSLCHKIKSDAELGSTKVVMVSGKSFEADKQRARQYGADLFIEKPYNIETFASQIGEIAGRSAKPEPAPAPQAVPQVTSAAQAAVQAGVWGCRGLPGPKTPPNSNYGLKTSCVTLEIGGKRLILDAGSGIAAIGTQLALAAAQEVFVFLTHFHPDHTQGLGGFAAALPEGSVLHLSAAREPDKSLEQLVTEALENSLAPGTSPQAEIQLHEMLEQTYEILPGVRMSAFYANHPGTTLGYVIEAQGRKLVYCPDSELYGETATAMQDYDDRLSKICHGADLMIHDGRYTPEDYRTIKNSGHSSSLNPVHLAGRSEVKRLLLFHADSQYTDETLDRMGVAASRAIAEKGYSLECAVAREGMKVGV